jgi:hypothetical protein
MPSARDHLRRVIRSASASKLQNLVRKKPNGFIIRLAQAVFPDHIKVLRDAFARRRASQEFR